MPQTLVALYESSATAETARDRLQALGVPEGSLDLHAMGENGAAPGSAPSGGLLHLRDFFAPRSLAGGGAVLVALEVPERLLAEAAGVLEADAIDVRKHPDPV